MKHLFLFALLLNNLSFATTVPEAEGEKGCLKKEILRLLAKTEYKNIEIGTIDLGTRTEFDAKDAGGNRLIGIIYADYFKKNEMFHCHLDTHTAWPTAAVMSGNTKAFALMNEKEERLFSVSKTYKVKGKNYSL